MENNTPKQEGDYYQKLREKFRKWASSKEGKTFQMATEQAIQTRFCTKESTKKC